MEDGTGEHTPQHFLNSYSLSSYMSHNYLKLLTLCPYELIKMLNMFISIKFEPPSSISAMHLTSCQPSACKEAIFLLVFVFPSASSITQKLIYGFQWIFTYSYFIIFFVFIHFVLFWGLFHHRFDPVKVLQRPTPKNKDSPSAKI